MRMAVASVLLLVPVVCKAQSLQALQSLSIDQLANIEVTSVSRRPQPLSRTPASIYVITADDIRRSGFMTLADVLRLAPNLEVTEGGSENFSVTARGMNNVLDANKMLVMIDGRSIYSPIHSETFWDQLQVPLDDIDRIEVISGPGGTQWGPNAVNGVINIITKNAKDTQGGLLDLKAGTIDQNGLIQYGGKFGTQGSYRVYSQAEGFGPTTHPGGASAGDNWHGAETGFRTDWQNKTGTDLVMTEGDFYRNNDAIDNGRQYGGDITARWTHNFSSDSSLQVQTSYDQEHRYSATWDDTIGANDDYSSYDLQAQHNIKIGRNNIVWGGEVNVISDDLVFGGGVIKIVPPSLTISTENVFGQDTYSITDDLQLTFGTKVQYSSYTGTAYLPSVRLGWTVNDKNYLWAAVSRAVRTPSRIDRDYEIPGALALSSDFQDENLIAYELGYRAQPSKNVSLSVSLYYNQYSNLRTLNPIMPTVQNDFAFYTIGNSEAGDTYGLEAWGDWRVLEDWGILKYWKLSAGVDLLRKDLHLTSVGAIDESSGNDPGYQFSLRSSMNFAHNVTFDFGVKMISNLDNPYVEGYTEADANLTWQITPKIAVTLAGNGLFSARHAEIIEYVPPGQVPDPYYVQRNIWLGLRLKF